MKTIKAALFIFLVLLVATGAWAAGSCTQRLASFGNSTATVTFVCTGDSSDGTIPDTAISTANMTAIMNAGTRFLYSVTAYPTSGGTAPDAADVSILMLGRDLLGGKGVNLIHATATQATAPYNTFSSMYEYPAIIGTVTLSVANQATVSANYTIVLDFER